MYNNLTFSIYLTLYNMVIRKLGDISLLFLICISLFSIGHGYALQNGLLPIGEMSDSGSTITQTEGEYSFSFQENVHIIGEDNSVYEHSFGVFLKVSVFNISKFSIGFHFTTPFDTIVGGSPSLFIGTSNFEIDFTGPSMSDNSNFQYIFKTIGGSVYIGEIGIDLTIDTADEMSSIIGYEKIEIEFINGTSSSISLDEYIFDQIEYITTLGPDNVLISINFFMIVNSILLYPLLKRSKPSSS